MREIAELAEESPEEAPEEHVGDPITLDDVSVRIDGEVSFKARSVSDRLDHEVYQFANPEEALSNLAPVLEAFERSVSTPFPGHSYVDVPISRYSVFDVDIDLLESNPTAAILRGAQQRTSEAFEDGRGKDGQGRWQCIQGADVNPLSLWVTLSTSSSVLHYFCEDKIVFHPLGFLGCGYSEGMRSHFGEKPIISFLVSYNLSMSNPVPAKSCPSLGWTIFWLLVFSPVAVWQGYKAFVYRKACLVGGAEPESRSMVVLVLGVVALVFLVFTVVVVALAVTKITGATDATVEGLLLTSPSWL